VILHDTQQNGQWQFVSGGNSFWVMGLVIEIHMKCSSVLAIVNRAVITVCTCRYTLSMPVSWFI
jgi:hypothetical protein